MNSLSSPLLGKKCTACGIFLPIIKFGPHSTGPLGRKTRCKECLVTETVNFRKRYPEKRKNYNQLNADRNRRTQWLAQLRKKYNMTELDYNDILEEQSGACAICNLPEVVKRNGNIKKLTVDHCHKTGMVRGLLCNKCNAGIGMLKDDPRLIENALTYLISSETYITSLGW